MSATFPMRTGTISYQIGLSPPAATGSWSVSLGFLDQNENSWSMSGVSGKIYDNSGYMVGGYNSNTDTMMHGVISGADHSIYQDGILLSNAGNQEENDYNFVDISGTYMGGYLPSVAVLGKEVRNTSQNQTVPFWNKQNDDRVYFVTENANADIGFIRAISGMGFTFETGSLTGSNINPGLLDALYGLIIFGSATSSGLYGSGAWNTLDIPMMSLNSDLVCSGNLGWSRSVPKSWENSTTSTGQACVFPNSFADAGRNATLWAEGPTVGWERFYYDYWVTEDWNDLFFVPYVTGEAGRHIRFQYNTPSAGNTTVTWNDNYVATGVYSSDVRPPVTPPLTGVPEDLHLTFTGIPGETGITMTLSNTLGGTGAPAADLTGSQWILDQMHNSGRVIPQTASYNVNNLYRRTTLTSGNYPTDSFNMYTGMPWGAASGLTLVAGDGGDTFVSDRQTSSLGETDYPLHNNFITVWHKGFWTGDVVSGNFTKQELMSFAVTPTGNDWTTGYNMWDTLTQSGKQLFVNAVAGFFIE